MGQWQHLVVNKWHCNKLFFTLAKFTRSALGTVNSWLQLTKLTKVCLAPHALAGTESCLHLFSELMQPPGGQQDWLQQRMEGNAENQECIICAPNVRQKGCYYFKALVGPLWQICSERYFKAELEDM